MIPLKLPKEELDMWISSLQRYFEEEHAEPLGRLAAENLLHFVLKEAGPHLYNQGIEDAAKLYAMRSAAVEEDMYALKQYPKKDKSSKSK